VFSVFIAEWRQELLKADSEAKIQEMSPLTFNHTLSAYINCFRDQGYLSGRQEYSEDGKEKGSEEAKGKGTEDEKEARSWKNNYHQ